MRKFTMILSFMLLSFFLISCTTNTHHLKLLYSDDHVKEIKIVTSTYDSQATVELPEDLTLKEGENKFEVKVTAENQKNTKDGNKSFFDHNSLSFPWVFYFTILSDKFQ